MYSQKVVKPYTEIWILIFPGNTYWFLKPGMVMYLLVWPQTMWVERTIKVCKYCTSLMAAIAITVPNNRAYAVRSKWVIPFTWWVFKLMPDRLKWVIPFTWWAFKKMPERLKWVIPFTWRAFKLILKFLNFGYLPSGQLHQIVFFLQVIKRSIMYGFFDALECSEYIFKSQD